MVFTSLSMKCCFNLYFNHAAYGDGYGAKRMRKLVQRRTVDYTSTAVRYLQVPCNNLSTFSDVHVKVVLSLVIPGNLVLDY